MKVDTSDAISGTARPHILAAGHPGAGVRLADVLARPSVVPCFIAAVTAVTFIGTLANGFVDWDDSALIVQNEAYRGLGWRQLTWMFSNVMMGHYVPVTWLTLGLDFVLWGMRPVGYHLTNVVLHATNAALVYLLAIRLLKAGTRFSLPRRRLAAVVAALFFALHPLRTESVAWVTERRDVLSGLFFFLTLLLYLASHRAVRTTGTAVETGESLGIRYWLCQALAWVTYLLAIFSKSIVMTLPVILVLLDCFPLRRLGTDWRSWARPPGWLVWREKIPFAALGVLAAILGYFAQEANGFFTSSDLVPWRARPSIVLYSLWFYTWKTVVPVRLAPLYELPAKVDPLALRFFVPAAIVVFLTVALVVLRRRWPAGLTAWLAYTVLLAPVAGLTHSGYQLAHDRYSYLPCLAWALLLGAGVAWLVDARAQRRLRPAFVKIAVGGVAVWLIGLGGLTWQQVQTWHDTDTLWLNASEAEPECVLCRYNVGARAFNSGFHSVARDEFQRLLAVRPDRVQVNATLGLAYAALGDSEHAIRAYRRVLANNPSDAETHNNLGVVLQVVGRRREAIAELEYALRLAPDNAMVRSNLGIVHAQLGEHAPALVHLRRALELKPDLARARFELGSVLLATGRIDEARVQYEQLRPLDPTLASMLGPGFVTAW
jgi:protein O-mannosyl-transferase